MTHPTIAKYRESLARPASLRLSLTCVTVENADLAALLDIAEAAMKARRDHKRFQHIDNEQDRGDFCAPGCLKCELNLAIDRLGAAT